MSQKFLIAHHNVDYATSIQAYLAWYLGIPDDQVIRYDNGTEALNHLKSNPVDLLITAYELPTLDGLSLIEQAYEIHPDIVTCLISASIDLERDEAVQILVPNGLLNQPFTPEQFIKIVGSLTTLIEQPA